MATNGCPIVWLFQLPRSQAYGESILKIMDKFPALLDTHVALVGLGDVWMY